MKTVIIKDKILEIARFGIVGTTAMMIHYGIYYLLLSFMPVNLAFTIGYFLSFLYNFMMSSYFTFRVPPSWDRFIRFGASHGTNYLLQIILLNFFVHLIGIDPKLAPIPVYAISIPVNYLLVRLAMVRKLV